MKTKKCPDCKGELEKGALMNFMFGGAIVQRHGDIDLEDTPSKLKSEGTFKNIRKTSTLRCKNCNRIYLYAQESVISSSGYNHYKTLIVSLVVAILFTAAIFLYIFLIT